MKIETITVLMAAVDCDATLADVSVAWKLISLGADPNATDKNGYDSLNFAAKKGLTNMVRSLLATGTDLFTELPDGKNARAIAKEYGRWEIV